MAGPREEFLSRARSAREREIYLLVWDHPIKAWFYAWYLKFIICYLELINLGQEVYLWWLSDR